MRYSREILRLKSTTSLTNREIANSIGRSPSIVSDCLGRFKVAGLSWPLPADLSDDHVLEARLYRSPADPPTDREIPDWVSVHRDRRKKSVTLLLLWQEYREQHKDGFQYAWFCQHYEAFRRRLDPVMRQEHPFGERCFTDYAGPTVPIVDPTTGVVQDASIFVGVLGASNYTYAEASWSESLQSWLRSHIRMYNFYGGVTAIEVPDNLKSAVQRADNYEPRINPTFFEFGRHYGVAIMPARKRKPRDKAKVEAAVLLVERWILAVLRKRTFYSLADLNEAIAQLLEKLNNRPFKRMEGSRRSVFEAYERAALSALPLTPFIVGIFKRARVHIDYHVELDAHYYSVPHTLVGELMDARLTDCTVEIFHDNVRVASHIRSYLKGKSTTLLEHMPRKHQEYVKWTPERLVAWALKTGTATANVVHHIMKKRLHPAQGFRACLGVLRLSDKYGAPRLEDACRRAVAFGAYSCRHVRSILERELDRETLPETTTTTTPAPEPHENIRGAEAFE
jgi:transposase